MNNQEIPCTNSVANYFGPAYDIEQHKPEFIPGGMPPRTFAGPTIHGSLKLYPLRALTAVVALGGGT